MPFTVNKNLSVPTAGSLTGTWGTGSSESINEGVTELVDRMLGGLLNKSMAAADVTLTGTEPQNAIIRLTGVLPANRVLTNSNVGFYFVENLTTGSFTVTVTNGVAGVVVPQGARSIVIADATNGCRLWGTLGFVVGTTKQAFFNSTVPSGWAADTSVNNGTIRLVSSTGGGTGGTSDFTDVFAARTIAANMLPNITMSVTDPGHVHNVLRYDSLRTSGTDNGVNPETWCRGTNTVSSSSATTGISVAVDNTARGGVTQQTFGFAVKYRDALIGTFGG